MSMTSYVRLFGLDLWWILAFVVVVFIDGLDDIAHNDVLGSRPLILSYVRAKIGFTLFE